MRRRLINGPDGRGCTEDYLNTSFREIINLKAALDQHSIVAITDPQGRITYANDKFCAISQYSRDELIGQDHRIINSGLHPKELFRRMWTTIKSGRVWKGELRNRAKDGSFYWVDTTIVPFLDANGQPYQFVSIRTDITERKNAEEEVRRLNRELEERVQTRTSELEATCKELEAFSYAVSHDLRAPLRHIAGYIGLLRKACGPSLPADAARHIETISGSAQEMSALIDDLLLFSRMSRSEMRRQRVNLNRVVEEAIRSLSAEMEGRNIRWKKTPLPDADGDPAMLRQVFVNLLSNAVKYSKPRDPAEIEIGWHLVNETETTFYVRDNGVGFEMKYAHKLFGVFQRLHSSSEFPGTGIGLANVRRIISRHGGRTWAEGAVGAGAAFYFSLPQKPESPAKQSA